MSKRKRGFVEIVMHYRSIMLLVYAVLIAFGVYSLARMPKNEFPEFTVRQGIIVGVYPGATAQEVEEQLSKPLEVFLWEFKEIKKAKTYSQSKDGMCIVFVELNDDINNKDEFWSKFKLRLNQFKSSLPQGVLALMANDDFGDTSAMLITLESKDKTYRQLHDMMTQLQDSLRRIPTISKLSVVGEQREQIGVYIDREKLSKYGINASTLLLKLSAQTNTMPSGAIDDGVTDKPIYVQSEMNTEHDLAQQIVYTDPMGNVVRLRDVADIKREYPKPSNYIKNNGTKCLVLSIEMRQGNNIVAFGEQVTATIENFKADMPDDVSISVITDQGNVVNHSIKDFLLELVIAIISVIIVIVILLPMRVAMVAAATIPITIFTSLGLFYAFGLELNTVTLAALIVTLGMIVDDSIVIIDCYMEKLDEGMSRWHAACHAAQEFFQSILTATLAISLTFFPLLITMKGMFRDFVKWFPYGISIVLFTSLIVAATLVPLLQFNFIRKGLKEDEGKKKRKGLLDYIQGGYNVLIYHCFKHPFIVIGAGLACIVLGALFFQAQPQKLMPYADRDQFSVEIYLPSGTSIDRTAQVADSMQHILQKDERVKSITTFYGKGSPRFQTSYAPQIGGNNFAQFIVNTVSNAATIELLDEYTARYVDYFPDARIRFKQLDYSNATSPIEFRLTGGSLSQLKAAADSAMQLIRQSDKVLFVRNSFQEYTPALRVFLDSDEATRLGVSKSLASLNLASRFGQGVSLTTLWEGDYALDVKLKDIKADQQTAEDLVNSTIMSPIPSINVPLRQVASITPEWETGMIQRRNGLREVAITADMMRGNNLNKVIDELHEELQQKLPLPEGMTLTIGGQRESDLETQPQIMGGLAISVVVIFVILLFHLRDIRLSLLILVSLSFSLLGAASGVWLMDTPVSMTSILGIISLMGIIVRNSIIMVDYAQELRIKHRISAKHAAYQAAVRRMSPIFLTSAAASMGVIPMVIANTPMWGPMGAVVCFGTLITMIFIVTMIPIGYWLIFRLEDHRRVLKNEKERAMQMKRKKAGIFTALAMLIIGSVTVQAQPAQRLTLDACKALALTRNVKIRTGELQILAADAQKQEAEAKRLPTVSANAAAFKANKDLVDVDYSLSSETQQNLAAALTAMGLNPSVLASLPTSYSMSLIDRGIVAQLSAIQPLYAGGRITTANRLAAVNREVKKLLLAQTTDQVTATTEHYYHQLISLYAKQATLTTAAEQLSSIHRDAQNAVRAGLRNRSDVLSVELKQNELEASALKVHNGISLVKMLLAHHIGLPTDSFDIVDQLPETLPHPDTYLTNHSAVLETLTEAQLLNKQVEAAQLDTRLTRGAMLPTVSVGLSGSYTNIDGGQLENLGAVGFATVSLPVSEWWNTRHSVKRKRLAEEEARLVREDSKQWLLINMQSKFNDLLQAYRQIAVAKKSIAAAAENLRLNRDYYQAGTTTVSELMNAQTQDTQAKDTYTDAVIAYVNARTAYLQATGRGLQMTP